ncbi:MAG: hypothetical protein ACK4QL_06220 [Pseudanabaenaceae cyanobacterium]
MGRSLLISGGLFCLVGVVPAWALEPGLYHGGGNRYIAIGRRGERLCYQGASDRGITTASLTKVQTGYQVYGWDSQVLLIPQSTDRLRLGNTIYQRVQGSAIDPQGMLNCLLNPSNFSLQVDRLSK